MGFFGIIFFFLLGCMFIYGIVTNKNSNPYEPKESLKAASDIRNFVISALVIFVIICIILFGMLLSELG